MRIPYCMEQLTTSEEVKRGLGGSLLLFSSDKTTLHYRVQNGSLYCFIILSFVNS